MNCTSIFGPGATFNVEVSLIAFDLPFEPDSRLQVSLLDERLLDALDAVADVEEVEACRSP